MLLYQLLERLDAGRSWLVGLRRLRFRGWARWLFIGLMAFGIVSSLGGMVLQASVMSGMYEQFSVLHDARPGQMPNMGPFFIGIGVMSALMSLGFVALYGWIIKRLLAPEVVATQAALAGFVRSLGREIGARGATANLRALIHMSGLRLCTMAQWEIRRLFQLVRHEVFSVSPFLGSFLAPKCVPLGYCDEDRNRDEHCPIRPHKDNVLGAWAEKKAAAKAAGRELPTL